MIVIYAIFRRGVYVDFVYTIYSTYDITTLSVYVCIYIFMYIWISVHVLCNVSIFVCFYCTFVLLSQQWLNKDVQSINQSIKFTTTTYRGHKSVRQFVRSSGLWMSLQFFVRLIPPQDHLFCLILVYLFIHLFICYLLIYIHICIFFFLCVCVCGGGGGGGYCVACHLVFFSLIVWN